ncbi:GPCR family 3, C-terminal,Bride of sevenless protein [Cinara cedri]|uniref:GPCR family 3, C-terminal,Bride of sevenless protein n=1 Tax=Cinara cedri TaxID=506608 RepID=A0A5E4MM45_9HEMI|nr:GPCR family 3, C-terminal,Bride of sevenless protein [Cinara cedri]
MRFGSLLMLIVCALHVSNCLECEQSQINGQSMSFFKTNGDISLTGLFDVYDEKCSGPTSTGIHMMEMVVTVVQILNSINYVPGITLGLTLYEVCSFRSSDLQKALISFVVDQDCNNSTIPIAIYTTDDVRTKIVDGPQLGLDVPITAVGPIIDVDAHVESAVKFLTVNNISVADVLVAQDSEVARRFEGIANANGLCINSTVLVRELGNLNESSIVVIIANKSIIKLILESSSNIHVSHFIIIPLDGPLPPKPDFVYGSYVFQAYGTCSVANKNSGDGGTMNTSDYGQATTLATNTGVTSAEQAVSAQFVQTAADLLRIADAYNGKADEPAECGQNASASECVGTATGNWSAAAAAVGYSAGAVGRVLDKLQLLPDDSEYNVTLVHVTEYGGNGETIGSYLQDSNGTRRLQLNGDGAYLIACAENACPTCSLSAVPTATPPPTSDFGSAVWVTWKEDVRVASTLTVAVVGAVCAACIAVFILVRVCKKDVMEGNPTFSFVLIVGTLLMYASAVPFAVDDTAYPHAVCYAKLFGASASCSIVFSTMLARTIMIAACDCDSSFMSHVNGYLQTVLCAFTVAVQFALLLQFLAIHAIVPSSDLCRVFVNSGHLFLGSLSYDGLLLVLLCATSPFVFRSKRNYREGACFAVAAYLMVVVWLCWCMAYTLLPRKWCDTCVMVGLTATATVIVVTVFIPRTYMMMFGIVREQITSSLPSLGYGHTASVTDVNYRSTQALYDSVHVAVPAKCHSSTFKGQSNPNYYSPAGSQIHSIPRSRPLTPVNEYDVPPSSDNRITRF